MSLFHRLALSDKVLCLPWACNFKAKEIIPTVHDVRLPRMIRRRVNHDCNPRRTPNRFTGKKVTPFFAPTSQPAERLHGLARTIKSCVWR